MLNKVHGRYYVNLSSVVVFNADINVYGKHCLPLRRDAIFQFISKLPEVPEGKHLVILTDSIFRLSEDHIAALRKRFPCFMVQWWHSEFWGVTTWLEEDVTIYN